MWQEKGSELEHEQITLSAETDLADTVDGSSLASWDTAEQSVVSRSEVDLSARGTQCLERLPLALPTMPTLRIAQQ